jgi:two-component system repressor protein LuxO
MTHVVLLVDDDDHVLHGLARALSRQPYRLCTARSAEEAMYILKAHDVDLIVADEQMPGMSGNELLAWVAKQYPDVMRIVLTGCADTEIAIRAINEGAVLHFFRKPCDEVQLAIAIRKALEHKDMLRENRRLLQLRAEQTTQLRAIGDELASLTRMLSAESPRSLPDGLGSDGTAEGQQGTAPESEAGVVVAAALDVVAKVQRLVAELSEQEK